MKNNGVSGTVFKREELDAALRHAFDVFERCACNFLLGGETLKDIVEGDALKTGQIDIVVEKRQLAESTMGMLKSLATSGDINLYMKNYKVTTKGFEWDYMGIPIKIRVATRKYKFLASPTSLWYNYDVYLVPNPVQEYLKVRNLIR